MTPKEAIETIKIAIAEVEWNYPLNYAVAFEVAIEALEKQIPKKPTEKAQEGFDFEIAHCLVCSYCNASIVNVWSKAEYRPKFCHYCGQALDWSDTE